MRIEPLALTVGATLLVTSVARADEWDDQIRKSTKQERKERHELTDDEIEASRASWREFRNEHRFLVDFEIHGGFYAGGSSGGTFILEPRGNYILPAGDFLELKFGIGFGINPFTEGYRRYDFVPGAGNCQVYGDGIWLIPDASVALHFRFPTGAFYMGPGLRTGIILSPADARWSCYGSGMSKTLMTSETQVFGMVGGTYDLGARVGHFDVGGWFGFFGVTDIGVLGQIGVLHMGYVF